MRKTSGFMIFVMATCFWSHSVLAFRPGGDIRLTLEVFNQAQDGTQGVSCSYVRDITSSDEFTWSLALWDDKRGFDCEYQAPTVTDENEKPVPEQPAFAASGKIKAALRPQMENERVLEVVSEIDVPVDGSGETDNNVPGSNASRTLAFSDNGSSYIPFAVLEDSVSQQLGGTEIFLRLRVEERLPDERSVHGKIRVAGLEDGAQLYLDGGHLEGRPPRGDWTIDLITPGVHLLEYRRDDEIVSGRLFRVIPDKTTVIQYGDPSSALTIGLQPNGENASGFMEYRRGKDDAVVIRVPAGEFLMGNTETERSPLEHMVNLPDFLIDKTGVTWSQYKQFADETGTPLPPHDPYWGINDDEPAAFVTWDEARSYCQWAGARLPTEAEREKAARGTDGRMYPWGEQEPSKELAAFRISWGYGHPAEVGAHPAGASPYGALDMGGNMWEWCEDWYGNEYYAVSPYENPKGPESGISHVVRGGSWDSRPTVLSASCRSWGHRGYRDGDFGFRCAMSAPQ